MVRWIEYNDATDDFTVKVKNLKDDKDEQERFTHVIVATGLFGTTYMPTYPGLDQFPGRILHAKEVRHAKEFEGQQILLIGSRWSAQDLAIQFLKYSARNVIMSYRKNPTGLTWPKGIEERPAVAKFEDTVVHFQDGTTAKIDVVIYCTGYKLHHPFLPEELRIKPDISIYPDNLYKGVVWTKAGNMKFVYLGVMYATYFLHFLDVQAFWAVRYITGAEKPPSKQEMLDDMERFKTKRDSLGDGWDFEKLEFVTKYLLSLCEDNGYTKAADKAKTILHEEWQHKLKDVSSYRDKQYTSIHTGSLSTVPVIPWMNAFDESSHEFNRPITNSAE